MTHFIIVILALLLESGTEPVVSLRDACSWNRARASPGSGFSWDLMEFSAWGRMKSRGDHAHWALECCPCQEACFTNETYFTNEKSLLLSGMIMKKLLKVIRYQHSGRIIITTFVLWLGIEPWFPGSCVGVLPPSNTSQANHIFNIFYPIVNHPFFFFCAM